MEINHLRYEAVAEYSSVFGHPLDDSSLIDKLSHISCQKILAILSRFSCLHIAVCNGDDAAMKLNDYLRFIHSVHIDDLGGNKYIYNQFRFIMCSQSIFVLDKWAIKYCPVSTNAEPITQKDVCLIMDLLLVVNDKLPKSEVEGNETEYLYLMLYHNTHKAIKNEIARSYYVFSKLAYEDNETSSWLKQYEEKCGFSLEQRLAVLTNSLAHMLPRYTLPDFFIGVYTTVNGFNAQGLSPVYDKVMETVRADRKTIRSGLRRDLEQVWDFEPFYRYPFIKIKDEQIAFSVDSILYQLWEGLYWNVRYTLQRDDGVEFMTDFGKPFEHYIQEISRESANRSGKIVRYQNEFLYRYEGNQKASTDCYLRVNDVLVAVEAKAKSPHSDTISGVAHEAIETEVNELMVAPIEQAAKRLKEITSEKAEITDGEKQFFEGIERTIILSVSMEKVQPVGKLLYEFDERVKETISGTNVVAYHNVSIQDYEVICGLIEDYPEEVSAILLRWFEDQRKDSRSAVVLSNFLHTFNKKYRCLEYVSLLFDQAFEEIIKRTFEKPTTLDTLQQ